MWHFKVSKGCTSIFPINDPLAMNASHFPYKPFLEAMKANNKNFPDNLIMAKNQPCCLKRSSLHQRIILVLLWLVRNFATAGFCIISYFLF